MSTWQLCYEAEYRNSQSWWAIEALGSRGITVLAHRVDGVVEHEPEGPGRRMLQHQDHGPREVRISEPRSGDKQLPRQVLSQAEIVTLVRIVTLLRFVWRSPFSAHA